MDYQSILIRYTFILLLISLISGCDRKISPEPLRIKGPSTSQLTLYYDSVFEYEFGASGGDGVYRYRYIQNPKIDDVDSTGFIQNPIEMTIEVKDDAKPSFILQAKPVLPADGTSVEFSNQKFTFGIELTDGHNVVTENYEFTLKKNKLSITSVDAIVEGRVYNLIAKNLLRLLESDPTTAGVCESVKGRAYEKNINNAGVTTYPYVFQVATDAKVASRTEFFYRFSSKYSEGSSEFSSSNLGSARKNVDFLDSVYSVVLEPGDETCVGYIDLYDDSIIEGDEVLTIEFFEATGEAVDIVNAKANLTIRDNETLPAYTSQSIVRNRGDKVIVPFTLSRPLDYPLSFNVLINQELTTASNTDFSFEPQSGVVTFNPGELVASYTVSLLDVDNESTTTIDKKIVIETSIDRLIADVDPYTIEINQWADPINIEKEVVGHSVNNDEVIDFVSDSDGIITTLIKSTGSSSSSAKLSSYNRDSSPYNFSLLGDVELSKLGVNVEPKAIVIDSLDNISVILNVNNSYADIFRGGMDFVVMKYNKAEDGYYKLISAKQYGTDGDDFVSGATIKNNILYVYGNTNGDSFEGAPSSETNNGGYDGFLYAINSSNSYKWARFIGTSNFDDLISVDVGNRDLISLVSTQNSDEDAFLHKLIPSSGLDQVDDNPLIIQSIQDDKPVSVKFDISASNFFVLLDSIANLDTDGDLTDSLTKDVQLLSYSSDNEINTNLSLSTLQDDFAKSLESTPNKLNFIVSGDTYGEFAGNIKRGLTGSDVFTAIVDTDGSSSIILNNTLQFGSPGNDEVISVKAVSNTKYLMLWSEDFTQPGEKVYRISAFSIDGKKLSRNPE